MTIPNLPVLAPDSSLQPNPSNRFEDCVCIELAGKQVDDQTIEISAQIAFGIHDFRNNWPVVRFAINGGELRLDLTGLRFEHGEHAPEMALSVNKKITDTNAMETSRGLKSSLKGGVKAAHLGEATAAIERETQEGRRDSNGRSEESSYTVAQVQPLIGRRPGWRFSNETAAPYLKGTILKALTGAGTIIGEQVQVSATFRVRESDVFIEVADLFACIPVSSRIKHRLARRAFFKRLIEPNGEMYLSRAVLINE